MRPERLEDFTGEVRPSGSQLNYRTCPVCGSNGWKLYVNPDSGAWLCFMGSCGAHGRVKVGTSVAQILRKLHGQASGKQSWPEVGLPHHKALSVRAREFILAKYKMDLSPYMLVEGLDGMVGRIVIPYCNQRGEIIYWNARSILPDVQPKYHAMGGRHPLYVPNYVRPADLNLHPVVLVEGAFDAMKVHCTSGQIAVALGGKKLPRYLLGELLAISRGPYVVMLDSDALGSALSLVRQLEPFVERVRCISLPTGEDPGSMEPGHLGRFVKDVCYEF